MNLKNITNFLEAEIRLHQNNCPAHIKEQASWRLQQIKEKSPECLKRIGYCSACSKRGEPNDQCSCLKGHFIGPIGSFCLDCGCDTFEKVFQMQKCEGGCFPERMDEKDWNKFKIKNDVNS